MIAKAIENRRPVVIQWDQGGYAIDVTMDRPEMIQGGAVVILNAPPKVIHSNESYHIFGPRRPVDNSEFVELLKAEPSTEAGS